MHINPLVHVAICQSVAVELSSPDSKRSPDAHEVCIRACVCVCVPALEK